MQIVARVMLFIGGALMCPLALAQESVEQRHMGVASCASSMCHGKLQAAPGRNVRLNEYRTWSNPDRHAFAFRTLQGGESKQIARALQLGDPAKEKLCLDCHADNVPEDLRGPKFVLEDGIGCEACHGGSGKWLESHAARSSSHAANLAAGLYPLEVPLQRAERCLTCHLGTKDRFATHRIMAAGHPRLTFELDSFSTRQPPHFDVDADYVQRKGNAGSAALWVAGQLAAARAQLQLLQTSWFQSGGAFPDAAFYDCSSCHHAMRQYNWNTQRLGSGASAGTPRLQIPNVQLVPVLAAVLAPAQSNKLQGLAEELQKAGAMDVTAARRIAAQLLESLRSWNQLVPKDLSPITMRSLRAALIQHAANDRVADYGTAEQVFYGLESFSYAIGDFQDKRTALDALFNAIEAEASFSPQQFAKASRQVRLKFDAVAPAAVQPPPAELTKHPPIRG